MCHLFICHIWFTNWVVNWHIKANCMCQIQRIFWTHSHMMHHKYVLRIVWTQLNALWRMHASNKMSNILILRYAWNFEVRQILHITFFVTIDLKNKKGSMQNLPKLENKVAVRYRYLIASFTLASKSLHLGSELLASSSECVPTILWMS